MLSHPFGLATAVATLVLAVLGSVPARAYVVYKVGGDAACPYTSIQAAIDALPADKGNLPDAKGKIPLSIGENSRFHSGELPYPLGKTPASTGEISPNNTDNSVDNSERENKRVLSEL